MDNDINVQLSEDDRKLRVRCSDASIITLKPVKWVDIDDFIELHIILIAEFFKCNGALGSFFRGSNKAVWDTVEKMCGMCPVVGTDKTLTIQQIDNFSVAELAQIFVSTTETFDADGWITPENKRFKPGLLAIINSLDFFEVLQKAVERRKALDKPPETPLDQMEEVKVEP